MQYELVPMGTGDNKFGFYRCSYKDSDQYTLVADISELDLTVLKSQFDEVELSEYNAPAYRLYRQVWA